MLQVGDGEVGRLPGYLDDFRITRSFRLRRGRLRRGRERSDNRLFQKLAWPISKPASGPIYPTTNESSLVKNLVTPSSSQDFFASGAFRGPQNHRYGINGAPSYWQGSGSFA